MSKRARFLAAAVAAGSVLAIVPGAQAELRVSKNYRLTADTNAFRGKDAVALAVNPANANHVVEVNNEYLGPDCEGTRSIDGGVTWSPADKLPVPAGFAPACSLIGDHLAESMYQTVAFGSGQNVYAAYASRKIVTGQSIIVGKSTDGGATWETATVAMLEGSTTCAPAPSTTLCPYYELPAIAVQPGAAPGNQDRVYVTAHETTAGLGTSGDAAFVVSNDGAATFSQPVAIDPPGENATDVSQPAISPVDGKVYVAWRLVGVPPAPGVTNPVGAVRIARSDNFGGTWQPAVTVATVNNEAANTNNPPGPNPSSASTFPRIAVGPTGNVYVVYNQGPDRPGAPAGGFQGTDHFIPPDSDVYFQRSLAPSFGTAWSDPKLINDATPRPGHESPASPPEFGVVTQTRHPNLAVAPNGRIDIVWQDRRHWYRGCIHTHVICQEARLGDTYYSSSSNNGTSFSANHRISDRSHNNDVGYDYRFGTGWTFGPVVAPQGNNALIVGWMDSRNGNFENDTQDIFLARVNLNGPASVPQESLPPTDPVSLSVRLSNHAYPGGGESLLASTFATRNGTKVVIANQADVPGILAAGVLARANLSQLLLSSSGGLSAAVKNEVRRLNPTGAYVVGNLSSQVQQDLEDAGVPNDEGQIVSIARPTASATARLVALAMDRRTAAQKTANTPAFNAAIIANPSSPDASAAAGLAAARRLPFLYVTRDSIPSATASALAALDINKTLVVGGPQWVGSGVQNALPAPTRLGGADQYATSRAVVTESIARGLATNLAYVTDGSSPINGALLGSTVGRVTGLMLLSPPPLASTAAGTVARMGLNDDLDRMILVRAIPAAAPPAAPAAFPGCPVLTANVIRGTAASNSITGTTGPDRIFAGTGNDVVDALAGNDCVDLGPGSDRGQGGLGNDFLVAGIGNDRVAGSSGNDRMRGNPGNDRLEGGRGNDRVFGDSGRDALLGSFGNDVLHGVSGRDRIAGSRGRDRINGGSGNDRITGGSSNDRIAGDAGSDRINGNSGRDRIRGNSGNDRITVRDNQRDRVNCGSGRDSVLADREDVVARNCERVRRL